MSISKLFFVGISALAIFSGPAFADRETVMNSCRTDLGLTDPACTCIADKSDEELNEKEYAFFIGIIQKRPAAEVIAETGISQDEMVKVGQWMQTTPGACQQ